MSSKKEIWKAIQFKGKKPSVNYMVSNRGRFGVKHDNGKVEVREFKPQEGGYRYNYKVDGKSKAIFIHKEVARAFVPKPSSKHSFIIRKDHNYLNNDSGNLKWATADEHRAHVINSPNALQSRKRRAITKSSTAKVFDEKSIKEVKKLIWDPKRKLTFKQIAEKYGVSEMQIYRIKSGELWFHVHVPHEPVHKRYKQNLENIEFQRKKAEKENERRAKAAKKRETKSKKREARLEKRSLRKSNKKKKKSTRRR